MIRRKELIKKSMFNQVGLASRVHVYLFLQLAILITDSAMPMQLHGFDNIFIWLTLKFRHPRARMERDP